jgi:hypothetical protein
MPTRIDVLLADIAALERELEFELIQVGTRWRYRIEADRIRFEHDAHEAHRRLKRGIARFLRESSLLNVVTAPVIYVMIVPIALLDFWLTVYQAICFRAYGIARVRRSAYIVIDRHHLAYLNGIEKMNCVYCGYANGVFAYAREIAGRTEQYWCPIRHAKRIKAPHTHYRHFVDYGDAEGYHSRLGRLRSDLKDEKDEKGETGSDVRDE